MARQAAEEEEEGGELYVVRKVKDMRRNKATNRWEFFVRWKGYPPEDNTWEGPQAFSDPGLYQPLVDKLRQLRKVTQAKEGAALKALRNTGWDLDEAIALIREQMTVEASKPRKKRAAPTEKEAAPRPARKVLPPSVGAPAARAAPGSAKPEAAAAPTVAPPAGSVSANPAASEKEELDWLHMLQKRETQMAPVPYAEVDFILDQQDKKAGGKPVPAYQIRWRGAGPEDDTWVVATRVKKAPNGLEAIKAFEQKRSDHPPTASVTQAAKDTRPAASVKASAPAGPAAIAEDKHSGKAAETAAATNQPAAVSKSTEQLVGTSYTHKRDHADAANVDQVKRLKSDTPPLRALPAAATAASVTARAVKLRTGQQYSELDAGQRELIDEFEQWQLTGQAKPPTEKTCKKYLQKFKQFLHSVHEEYDIPAKWNVCNTKKHDELIRTVKGSARNKRDHGECSAALNKFILFLDARSQGWTSSKPVVTRAGDTSSHNRGVQSRVDGQSKPNPKQKPKPKTLATEAIEKQRTMSKRAEEAKRKKDEVQQLMEKNRLREERHAAKKAQRQGKRKDRDDDDDQAQRSAAAARPELSTAKSSSSAGSASAAEMERLKARMTSLPDTGAQPKLGAIPKKRRPATAEGDDAVLEWQGKPIECDVCKSGITKGRASRGAMVDGRIFCNKCLPAECRPVRDAWLTRHAATNAEEIPRRPPNGNEGSSAYRSGTNDGRNSRDSRNPSPRPMKSSRLCKFFNTPRGCFRGDNCHFRHERSERPEALPNRPEPVRAARYAPGQHPDQIPLGQQHHAAQRYAAEQQEGSGGSATDQVPAAAAAQSIAFNTFDYGRDERTNRDTTKTEQAWSVILMEDTVRRIDAMAQFPRGVLNHVISLKFSEALDKSDEEFKRLFDQLLELKLQEQHKRELRNESTTCAKRWEQQTYEVDEQMMMKLDLKDVSYDSKRIHTPARGGCCSRIDAPVFDLCSHVLSKVKTDVNAQLVLDYKHQQDPAKHPKRGRAVFGAWPCPFCGKKAQCGCGWLDLEVDPTVVKILQQAPSDVDQVQVYCPSGDHSAPAAPSSPLEGGTIPILVQNERKSVVWRIPGARAGSAGGGLAKSALPADGGNGLVHTATIRAAGSDTDEDEEVDLT